MKKTFAATLVIALAFASAALAGSTKYYVYKHKSSNKCEITMRDQDAFKKAKGSSWVFIGVNSTRSGAEKIAKGAGCK